MSIGAEAKDRFGTEPGMGHLVLTLSIVLSVLYLFRTRAAPSISRMVIKAGSTASLSLWVAVQGGPPLLAIALGGGSMGDAFLAWHGETPFLLGLGSFLVAHLFYIRLFSQLSGSGQLERLVDVLTSFLGAFWYRGDDEGLQTAQSSATSANNTASGGTFWRASVAVILVGCFAPVLLSRLIPRVGKELRAPIIVYTTVIVCMVLAALAMDNGWVIAGALMFTSSDGILATETFLAGKDSAHLAWMPYAVWFLYYTGQLVMAYGILLEQS